MAGTVIPDEDLALTTAQALRQFPQRWANEGAKASGGVLWALFTAACTEAVFSITQVQYGLAAQRLNTETYPELDLASVDFFGQGVLPRAPGQSDAAFLQAIQAALFSPMATRGAISQAIQNLTGVAPRMIEPWNPGDTGCRDTLVSYRDIDTPSNPMLNTSAFTAYNGWIVTNIPAYAVLGNNSFLTRDDGGFRDANEYRLTVSVSTLEQLYATINRVRTWGTVVWVKTIPQTQSQVFILNVSKLDQGVLG